MTQQRPKVNMVKFAPLTLRKQYDDGDYGLFTVSVRNGYPRFTVFTTNKNREAAFDYNTMITAPFDYNSFNSFVKLFEKVIDSKPDTKFKIDCFNAKYVDNKRTDDIVLQSTVNIGKDAEGIIYLALIAEGKRKVKFEIEPSRWHKLYVGDEPVTDKAELSKLAAEGYLVTLKKLMGNQLVVDSMNNNANPVSNDKAANNTTKPEVDTSTLKEDDLF